MSYDTSERLRHVQQLIDNKRFDEARRILRSMPGDPVANSWLKNLSVIAPEHNGDQRPWQPYPPASPQQFDKRRRRRKIGPEWIFFGTVLVLMTVGFIAFLLHFREDGNGSDGSSGGSGSDNTAIDFNNGGGLDFVRYGDPIEYENGTLTVLSYQRPAGLMVVNGENFFDRGQFYPDEPPEGMEFIAIKFRFDCPNTVAECDGIGAQVGVGMSDDSIFLSIEYLPFPMGGIEFFIFETVGGGQSTEGYVTFAVPADASLTNLIILPGDELGDLDDSNAVFAAFPDPVDGYAIDYPWVEDSKQHPTLFRDLKAANPNVRIAYVSNDTGSSTVSIFVEESQASFSNEEQVIAAVADDVQSALSVWPTYSSEVEHMLIIVGDNNSGGEANAFVLIERFAIEGFLSGQYDSASFIGLWQILVD